MKFSIERTNVELYWEKGEPYLKVHYRFENDNCVKLGTFEKIGLPFPKNELPKTVLRLLGSYIDIDNLPLFPDSKGHPYYERIIKEKAIEMTTEEIEKVLGHKFKIVDKKENEND